MEPKRKRVRSTKIGDVFCVPINENTVRYMQYVISDRSQLTSDVVRVFKKEYPAEQLPDLETIVTDEVDFYVHCCTRAGLKQECWTFVGNIQQIGEPDKILFRIDTDEVSPMPKISYKWNLWYPNKQYRYVGKLNEKQKRESYYGIIYIPLSVVRMIRGIYKSPYPEPG